MVTLTVDKNKEFERALKEASRKLDDLRIPLSIIAKEWFKSNKAIFALGGYGKYAKYSKGYEKWKMKQFGSIQVLKVSGALEKSLTNPTDKFSVNTITNKKTLTVGTKVLSKGGAPYAIYLQNGTKFMKARPPVLFGTEQVAPTKLNVRVSNWGLILRTYVLQKSKSFGTIK